MYSLLEASLRYLGAWGALIECFGWRIVNISRAGFGVGEQRVSLVYRWWQRGFDRKVSFWCMELLNWVLKLFSFRDIMSKARIASSGGRISLRPFFAMRN